MEYPHGFPVNLQRPVEVARDAAELELRDALSKDKAHRLNEAYEFIVSVFRPFAHQACEAERQGAWAASQGRERVEWFLLQQLIPHAYDLARVSSFFPAPLYPPLRLDEFRLRVMERIKDSDVWREYLTERSSLGAVESRTDNSPEAALELCEQLETEASFVALQPPTVSIDARGQSQLSG